MAEYWTRGQTCYGENDDRILDRMTPGDNGTRIFDNLGSTMEPWILALMQGRLTPGPYTDRNFRGIFPYK